MGFENGRGEGVGRKTVGKERRGKRQTHSALDELGRGEGEPNAERGRSRVR